ncbi:MAG: nitroreductase [Lachnospiraceae bacterium]|jgi:nitroreductase|nr:nitroreductase [Lachnospiraceae bacterium]
MNEIIRSLYERKSVRVFEERPIPAECKKEILLSAMQAPTAGNQQLYTILDITDQELKDKLSVSCDNQPFIAKAPLVLIFCADILKWFDVFKEGGADPREPGCGDLILAIDDALIAAQNTVVAAESLGIGSCYIGDIMEQCELHREMLRLPEYVFPAAMLVYGYPTRQQKERIKPKRCRLEDMVQENYYQKRDGQQLRNMFDKETENRSFEEWSQAFCKRKYNSDFSKEMSRSVQEYLKDYLKIR